MDSRLKVFVSCQKPSVLCPLASKHTSMLLMKYKDNVLVYGMKYNIFPSLELFR